jgi:hypothetical protein
VVVRIYTISYYENRNQFLSDSKRPSMSDWAYTSSSSRHSAAEREMEEAARTITNPINYVLYPLYNSTLYPGAKKSVSLLG